MTRITNLSFSLLLFHDFMDSLGHPFYAELYILKGGINLVYSWQTEGSERSNDNIRGYQLECWVVGIYGNRLDNVL